MSIDSLPLIRRLLLITVILSACAVGSPTSIKPVIDSPSPSITMLTPIASRSVSVTQVTNDAVTGAMWSQDGLFVVYATRTVSNQPSQWWQFNVASRTYDRTQPPAKLDIRIWSLLDAINPPQDVDLLNHISPSGRHLIYTRMAEQSTLSTTKTPQEFSRTPVEIWIADSDGSRASRLGACGCRMIYGTIWFDNERKVIITCGYEGPPCINFADVDGSWFASLEDVTGYQHGSWGDLTLSPDETTLAIIDIVDPGNLWLVSLEGGNTRLIARNASSPSWSSNGRRLYYLQGADSLSAVSIQIYDVASDRSSTIVEWSTLQALSPTPTLGARLEVSPQENGAIIWYGALWLVKWTR
jgi:hypothetical protein